MLRARIYPMWRPIKRLVRSIVSCHPRGRGTGVSSRRLGVCAIVRFDLRICTELVEFTVGQPAEVIGTFGLTVADVFFAYAVPTATHVDIDFDGEKVSGQFGFDRPAR